MIKRQIDVKFDDLTLSGYSTLPTEPGLLTWIFQFSLVQAFDWYINWPGTKLRAVDPLSHGLARDMAFLPKTRKNV